MIAAPRTTADLAGRRALVLGFARSGVALVRMLADAGARVTVFDRRPPDELHDAIDHVAGRQVELALGAEPEIGERLIAEAELIFTSPSVSAHFPTTDAWLRESLQRAIAVGIPVISEVDLFLRLTQARLIGVTGTKGKTTTSALIGAMLSHAEIAHVVGGNIGRPLVELVDELTAQDWAVLELSELQLPTISRGVDVAVYTNILSDHLDRHGSVEAYRAVKSRLAELAGAADTVIFNREDEASRELQARLRTDALWYAVDDPGADAAVIDGVLTVLGVPVLPAVDVPLPGRHMLANVLGAALAAHVVGAEAHQLAAAIRHFPGVPHRLETIAVVDRVRYINDSQATIPVAAEAALRAFDAPVVLIAGGRGKGLDYATFAETATGRCRAAVLIGETAPELEELLRGRLDVELATSMEDAVERARELARPGDVVLLTPAAASFDMFIDYAARGDAFRDAVKRLADAGGHGGSA